MTRLKLHNKGFRKLRTLPVMDALVLRKAQAVARDLGPEFQAEQSPGRNRARAVVVPASPEGALKTARDPARMIGALNAARHA